MSRKSLRGSGYDYSLPGGYFVTSCSWKRLPSFTAPEIAQFIRSSWEGLLKIFGGLELGEFAVMPNHIHGIIWITDNGAYRLSPNGSHHIRRGEQPLAPTEENKFVALGNIVGAFKTTAASRINRIREAVGVPVWQRNYYEHVIRNEQKAERIRAYIRANPDHWQDDRNNPTHALFEISVRSMECSFDEYRP